MWKKYSSGRMPKCWNRSKMIRSNCFSLVSNSSSIGKEISASSLIGVASCLLGGRRMVKWMRSTEGSYFSRLRQTRSPG